MRGRSWLALAIRETRGSAGRLIFFAACLSVGVAAVVSVAGLSQALDHGLRSQARQLLAADLAVESRRPIPEEVLAAVDGLPGARRARVWELPSVVSVPGDSRESEDPGPSLLCELKAVEAGYPFYGSLETQPPLPLQELLDEDRVLVAPELLTRLDLKVGDTLRIGSGRYAISGTIIREPDRLEVSFTLGPRILMSWPALERSSLVGLGSRVKHRVLVRLAEGASGDDLRSAALAVRAVVEDPQFVEVETSAEAQPALRRGLKRVEQFLGLVALLSLLIGGIGVAQAVRAWLAGRMDAIAVLRALGVRPHEAFLLYLGQTVVLAVAGSLVGAAAGVVVARTVPHLLQNLLPLQVEVGFLLTAQLRGLALGVGVAVLFALRPLLDVLRVPPVRVLRRDAEPLPMRRRVAALLVAVLAAGIVATATAQSGSLLRGLQFAGGLIVATVVLSVGAWLVMRLVGGTGRELGGIALRHGLAALSRPGSGTLGAVVALGLGVLTVLGMHLVQSRLSAQLDADLPDEAPTVFLIDIQPDQWKGVEQELLAAGADHLESVDVVMARLRSINGVAVSDLIGEVEGDETRDRRRWVFTREQRLTSLENLPADNVIVEGELWSHPGRSEVSVEEDFASDLGVVVGDLVLFDVQGMPIELLVSSIRSVEWERFSINFFLVVEPGVLDGAPRFRIAAARLPEEAETVVQDRLASGYPNVTLLRLREVLEKIVAILRQVGFGIRLLGGFSVLAGVAILGGAVTAGAVRRGHQVALYKTLGMTRHQVAGVFAVEYALVGLVAGSIGTVGGVALAWAVTRLGFQISWAWAPLTYVGAVAATLALSVVAGLAASLRALSVRPLKILRQGQ